VRFRIGPAAALIASSVWAAVLQLAIVPIYLNHLGTEAFGLFGIFLFLRTILLALDFGIGPTVNRELARHHAGTAIQNGPDFLRTAEAWILTATILPALAVFTAAPAVVTRWIHSTELPAGEVTMALRMMCLAAATQALTTFYQSGLMGSHRHRTVALASAATNAFTYIGAAAVVVAIARPLAFFGWLLAGSVVQLLVFIVSFYRVTPFRGGRFSVSAATRVRGFALGMAGTTIVGTVLAQADKVVLTRLLPLETFGYYSIASTAASALLVLVAPVFAFLYPTLSAEVAGASAEQLKRTYHRGAQLMSFLVLPAAAVLSIYSHQLIVVWTGNVLAADRAYTLVMLLVIGTAINAMMVVPYALQLAHGWSRMAFLIAASLVVIFVPALIALTSRLGPQGAAWAWLGFNALYLIIAAPITHRAAFPGENVKWLVRDVLIPAAAAFVVVGVFRLVVPVPLSRGGAALQLSAVAITALIVTGATLRGQWFGILQRTAAGTRNM
jgi:O-antigen/teichoic acid export membrane protein